MALVAGVEYTFIITATNAAGSDVIGTAKATPFTIPGAPGVGTAASGTSSRTAVISFTQGATNGNPITQYNYSTAGTAGPWTELVGTAIGTAPGSGDNTIVTATISQLDYGIPYTFNLQAQNAAGAGLPGTNTYGPVTLLKIYRRYTIGTVTGAYGITVDTANNNLYICLSVSSLEGSIRKIITNGTNTGAISSVGTNITRIIYSLAINPATKQIYHAVNLSGVFGAQAPNYSEAVVYSDSSSAFFGMALKGTSVYLANNGVNRNMKKTNITSPSALTIDTSVPLTAAYRWIAVGPKVGANDTIYVNDTPGPMKKIIGTNVSDVTYSTPSGTSTVSAAGGIAVDSQGNIYYNFNGVIYIISPTGQRSTITFSPSESFTNPNGMAIDTNDNLYVVDAASRISLITSS